VEKKKKEEKEEKKKEERKMMAWLMKRAVSSLIMVMLLLVSSRGEEGARFDRPAARRIVLKGEGREGSRVEGLVGRVVSRDLQSKWSQDHVGSTGFQVATGATASMGLRLRGGKQEEGQTEAASDSAALSNPSVANGGRGGCVIRVVDGRVGGGRSDGLGVNVIVNGSQTVAHLKSQIADRLNITAESQRVIYLGRELVDGAHLPNSEIIRYLTH